MDLRKQISYLLVAVILLAMAGMVLGGLATVLWGLGDRQAASVMAWVAFAFGTLWILGLICLLLAVAVQHVLAPRPGPSPDDTPSFTEPQSEEQP